MPTVPWVLRHCSNQLEAQRPPEVLLPSLLGQGSAQKTYFLVVLIEQLAAAFAQQAKRGA